MNPKTCPPATAVFGSPSLRRFPRRCLRAAGWGLGAWLLLARPAAAAEAPPPARFSVLNKPDCPIEWGGVLSLGIKGRLTGADPADIAGWKVALNGVQLGVARVFLGPSGDDLKADAEATVYRLVLLRPDFSAATANPAVSTVTPAVKNPGDVIAATIRSVAPERWSLNLLAVQVFFAGAPLTAEVGSAPPGIPAAPRNVVAFRLCSPWRIAGCLAVVVLLVVALVYAWMRSGAFRDDKGGVPYDQRLFSLGRVQLAFWTTLVVGGYLFIYLTTGQFVDILNSTASLLLGISAATTLLSAVTTPVAAPAAAPQVHVNWLVDILSDAQGINVHRLQMAIWTLVFGLVFVSQLVSQFAFPTFDSTAYVLMGISSGTYVWLKRSEH